MASSAEQPQRSIYPGYIGAAATSALCALACLPLYERLEQANIVMPFLLAVAISAALWGKGPGYFSALLSVLLFDILFVEPRFSLAVDDAEYLVTFGVMLTVAFLISHLASRLQQQLQHTREREEQTRALYECAHSLTGALEQAQVEDAIARTAASINAKNPAIYLPDDSEQLAFRPGRYRPEPGIPEQAVIRTVYNNGILHTSGDFSSDNHISVYLPLSGATRPRGVLVMELPETGSSLASGENNFMQALSALVASVLDRIHFIEVAQKSGLAMQAEQLRNSILSAISHDIRTPLTVITGMAETLLITEKSITDQGRETLLILREQSSRLHDMVENMLYLAKAQSGKANLKYEWIPIEEIIGASRNLLGESLDTHKITVELPDTLPLINVDASLMERVLCNLLDNARRHSPKGSTINISASATEDHFTIIVKNSGSKFPIENINQLLEPFARNISHKSSQGFGLGLTICRAIIEAHDGNINLYNSPEFDAEVRCILPLGTPPTMDADEEIIPESAS